MPMLVPVAFEVHRLRNIGKEDTQLMEQLLVSRLPHETDQFVNGAVNQAIGRAVGTELVIADVKTRTVGRIVTNVLRKQDSPTQIRLVIFLRLIVTSKPLVVSAKQDYSETGGQTPPAY